MRENIITVLRLIASPAHFFTLGVGLIMFLTASEVFNPALCPNYSAVAATLAKLPNAANAGSGLLTWAFIHVGLICLGFFGIVILLRLSLRELWEASESAALARMAPLAAFFIAALTAVVFAFMFNAAHDILWDHCGIEALNAWFYKKPNYASALEWAAISLALTWLILVSFYTTRLRILVEEDRHERAKLSHYLRMRKELHLLLLLIGWLIFLMTINTAVERTVAEATIKAAKIAAGTPAAKAAAAVIPFDIVTYLGLLHTALVIAFMGPAYYQLHATGESLVKQTFGDSPGDANWSDWTSRREAMREYLGLTKGLRELLTAGLPALTPLIAAVVSQFLKA